MMQIEGREVKVRGRLLRIGCMDGTGFLFLNNPEAAIAALRQSRRGIDLFTFSQKVSEVSPKYDYPMEWDNVAALAVSTFEHWWKHQIDGKTRNMARQAEKRGVMVRESPFDDALVRGIWQIYNECPIRQDRAFPHYGESIERVHEISETFLENSVFLGAYLGEHLIGFAKLTHTNDKSQAAIMHILSMIQHRDKAPTNALIAQAVRSCEARNIPYLVYSNFTYGKKGRDGLADFKINNGFCRVDLPRYYVPLTAIGEFALRLGLHHRLIDRLPQSLLPLFRKVRSAWYSHQKYEQATALDPSCSTNVKASE